MKNQQQEETTQQNKKGTKAKEGGSNLCSNHFGGCSSSTEIIGAG
jgi:hypothetical protein